MFVVGVYHGKVFKRKKEKNKVMENEKIGYTLQTAQREEICQMKFFSNWNLQWMNNLSINNGEPVEVKLVLDTFRSLG